MFSASCAADAEPELIPYGRATLRVFVSLTEHVEVICAFVDRRSNATIVTFVGRRFILAGFSFMLFSCGFNGLNQV